MNICSGTTCTQRQRCTLSLPNGLSLFKVPGDYNQNGLVDAADYVVWRDTVGQIGAGLAADGNGDRQIDAADFNVWRTFRHNRGLRTASTLPPVPEPATALISSIVLFAGQFVRIRRSISRNEMATLV